MTPILLTHDGARDYLSGANPDMLVTAIIVGKRKFYSRLALDRAVRERAGLPPVREVGQNETGGETPAGPDNAYDLWKQSLADGPP